MKTTLLLVRHGETEWNKLGKFQGCTDIELSENGINQAKNLKARLNGDFDYIYSSPLKRAYKTAMVVSEDTNKNVEILEDIREINFGSWEGLTIHQIAEKYPEIFKTWRTDKEEASFVGGDASTRNAVNRALRCVMEIIKKHRGEKIVIVAHGGIIKATLIGLFNWDMSMYHKIALGNTSINTITFNDDFKPVIVSINDVNHLEEEVKTV